MKLHLNAQTLDYHGNFYHRIADQRRIILSEIFIVQNIFLLLIFLYKIISDLDSV